jgi:hypothetical protein
MVKALRRAVSQSLAHAGYTAVATADWQALRTMRHVHRHDAAELEALYRRFVFPDLPTDPARAAVLYDLHGTTIGEGLYITAHLHRALAAVPGDVCEFGCNEGATSRLLASEIRADPTRTLWLFDSFEGLPEPSAKDRLIDDIAGLGSMGRYRGLMRAREDQVRDKLALVPFPPERTRIIKGWIDRTLATPDVPKQVAFAYVDFDFHDPIALALEFLDRTMAPGGAAVVDDYGFFSEGAQLAVDDFVAHAGGRWRLAMPLPEAGKFCVLEKLE